MFLLLVLVLNISILSQYSITENTTFGVFVQNKVYLVTVSTYMAHNVQKGRMLGFSSGRS